MLFEVWAPNAQTVELEINGRSRPLEPSAGRWWRLDLPEIGGGVDYAYRLDGGPPLPDPRSPWQPHGVHGPSRTVDHREFRWTDRGFQALPLAAGLIYELHVGTFTPEGTFAAAIDRLDRLVRLGATHVELMPVAEFAGTRGWGYDGVHLFAPFHHYGTPDDLKLLVDACHRVGLAVLLDVVYNHLGPVGNYLPRFGPYFHESRQTTWGAALNYDGPESDEVRRFLCDNALMWLRDYHFDGLRLDAVHAIVDTSAVHILEEIAGEVEQLEARLGRHLAVIAESDLNDPRIVWPREIGGYGFDAQWSDDVHHALHAVLTHERDGYYCDFGALEDVAAAMRQPYVYAGRHSRFRRRRHGRPPAGLSAHRFVAFLQNHDQVGNRARGERIHHLTSLDRTMIGTALVLLGPYVPLVFQGEEWAASSPFQFFVDYGDEPELTRAVSEGRRKEFAAFGWKPDDVPDPQAPETFLRSKLNWTEVGQAEHALALRWHEDLVRFRRQWPELTDGRLDRVGVAWDEAAQWLRMTRGRVVVAANLAERAGSVPLAEPGPRRVALASKPGVEIGAEAVVLPANSVAVVVAGTPIGVNLR